MPCVDWAVDLYAVWLNTKALKSSNLLKVIQQCKGHSLRTKIKTHELNGCTLMDWLNQRN